LAEPRTLRSAFARIKQAVHAGITCCTIIATSSTQTKQRTNFMSFYEDTVRNGHANGSTSTSPTPSPNSTLLREKYGIANPMAPDDGLDEEHAMVAEMNAARHS
jgi:hypothetical protein